MKDKRLKLLALAALLSLLFLHAPVRAQAQASTFTNPIVKSQAAPDPWMVYRDGFYYLTFTLGNRIEVWKSATITGFENATRAVVWQAPVSGSMCCNIWAPELHFIDGRWYLYFAADNGNDVNHRMYVLQSSTTDPQGSYFLRGKIAAKTDRWAIDGTVLQRPDGSLYFIWSGWMGTTPGPQHLFIAPMVNPWLIDAERTLISSPTNTWETMGWAVNEGPEAILKGEKTFIVYSASGGATPDYCLGLLTNTDGQLLNPASWQKSPGCVFWRTENVFGPGHNSFVKSPDQTEDWLIYHERDTSVSSWEGRTARAQKFTWNSDGTPSFGRPVAAGIAQTVPSGEIKQASAPVLLALEGAPQRAAALDSVTLARDPFTLANTHNFSPDQRTRIVLFATNAELQAGENLSALTAEAIDPTQRNFPLAVEYAGKVTGFDWLTQIVVRLPDGLPDTDHLAVRIYLRGAVSNQLLISVGSSLPLSQ